jgi:quercetin dioxygenase-like cupin family protein
MQSRQLLTAQGESFMALPHVASGELIPLYPLGDKLPHAVSSAFLKSSQLEVMRLVLVAGKSIPEHQVPGELTLQCLEGSVELRMRDSIQLLRANEMVFLAGNVPYAVHAMENSSLLMTVVVTRD